MLIMKYTALIQFGALYSIELIKVMFVECNKKKRIHMKSGLYNNQTN